MPARLDSVLEVVYLVFNEGYAASAGDDWMRTALCEEALRLGRILAHRLPGEAAVHGLLALMELQASRSAARLGGDGSPVLLDDQDRGRWDHAQVARGCAALQRALALDGGGDRYVLQAAIAECHAVARRAQDTDWARIAALYAALARAHPSPVVELNRVVAVSRAQPRSPGTPGRRQCSRRVPNRHADPPVRRPAPLLRPRSDGLRPWHAGRRG